MLRLLPPINTDIPAEPTHPRIIDADGVGWTKLADFGWVPDGDSRPQSWGRIYSWGPFVADDLNGELA